MATTFSVDSTEQFDDISHAWDAVRILAECVEHVTPGGHYFPGPFKLRGDKKTWLRKTLRELAVIRESNGLKSSTVTWVYAVDGMQWAITARTFDSGGTGVELSAYAGVDLIQTEEAMRTVLARASERGVRLKMGSVDYSANEDLPERSGTIVLNKGPMRRWKIFRAWVGPHLAAYIVGTVASLTAAGLWLLLGADN